MNSTEALHPVYGPFSYTVEKATKTQPGLVEVFVDGQSIGIAKRLAGGTKWSRTVKDFRGNLFNLYYRDAAEAARAIVADNAR